MAVPHLRLGQPRQVRLEPRVRIGVDGGEALGEALPLGGVEVASLRKGDPPVRVAHACMYVYTLGEVACPDDRAAHIYLSISISISISIYAPGAEFGVHPDDRAAHLARASAELLVALGRGGAERDMRLREIRGDVARYAETWAVAPEAIRGVLVGYW